VRSDRTGILGHALAALICEGFMPSAFSEKIAKHAKSKLTEASFVSDLQYFIRGDPWSAQIVVWLVETIDGLSDEEESQLGESLSPQWAKSYDSLIARRQAHPEEAAADAMEAVLIELWRSDWRDILSKKLNKVSAEIQISEQQPGEIAH